MGKKKGERNRQMEEVAMADDSIEQFADYAVEMLRESHHSDLEPFEAYAARVKAQVVEQLEDYRNRLTRGYRVLLDELAREEG